MKRAVLIVSILLLGIGLLSYPSFSNYLVEKNGSYAIEEYDKKIADQNEAALKKAWQEAVEYNESLSGQPVHDPFIEGSGMAMQDNYGEVLNIDDTMGYIEIPKISVNLPVYHGTNESVLQKGVGHLEGSSLPIGGEGVHSVLTGHTGLVHARIFTDLTELVEGDLFYVHVLDQTLAYQVDQIKVIEPEQADDLKRVEGSDYCTLLTCTPYGVNSHRLLVRGVRVDFIPEEMESIQKADTDSAADQVLKIAAGAAILVMLVLVLLTAVRYRKKNDPIKKYKEKQIKKSYWWDEDR